MEIVRVKKDFALEKFVNIRDELLEDVYSVFYEIIRKYDSNMDYSVKLYQVFLDFHNKFRMDFEWNLENFRIFRRLNFTNKDWMVIYKVFNNTLDYFDDNPELGNFVKLFYSDVILIGPYSEDFRTLDMSPELLELVPSEVKKLYWLFEDYFTSRDDELIGEIKKLSLHDAVCYCISYHLAYWINDNEIEDIDALDLYVVAINKLYKRPIFYQSDVDNASSIRVSIDTSWHFSDDVIRSEFAKINDWE